MYVTDEEFPAEFAVGMTLIQHILQQTNDHASKYKLVYLFLCLVTLKIHNAYLYLCNVPTNAQLCVEKKNQLDATERFIALIICSTCFGHFYAHHQELDTICVITA